MVKEKVGVTCCLHPSTAPFVKSTETALLVLRYIKEDKVFFNARILFRDSCKAYVFMQDPYCEWQINSSKKGDYQCSRRGRLEGSIRDPKGCPKVCNQWVGSVLQFRFLIVLDSNPFYHLLSAKGGRRVVNVSLTPASVHGVSQPRPASILLPTSLNTPMESAETGMTGKVRTILRLISS